jgi:FSR family fosmidomycin resistance protein-like MFS transporter
LSCPWACWPGRAGRRRLVILGGGILFVFTLLAVASARSFAVLLAAFVAFYPASGAFVSLTQAEIMDAWPERQAQVMARWDLAGAAGAVAGPLLLTAVLASGGAGGPDTWCWPGSARWSGSARCCEAGQRPDGRAATTEAEEAGQRPWTARIREIGTALRDWGTLRWLLLIEVADLLVDVFTGFLALYLVDVAHLTPAVAALAIAVRLGAALAGDAALIVILERVSDLTVLRVSAAAAALLYPAFLLVPASCRSWRAGRAERGHGPWYPVLQARLYGSLPDGVRWR